MNIYNDLCKLLNSEIECCKNQAKIGNKFKNLSYFRQCKVIIKNSVQKYGIEPQLNAFSIYGKTTDNIIIMKDLVDFLAIVLRDISNSDEKYIWIFCVCLLYCAFHEFGHLYLGHCQLVNNRKLAMSYGDNIFTELTTLDLQAMEFEADIYAVNSLVYFLKKNIYNKSYSKLWKYKTVDKFYSDTLFGLCGFFSIIKYLEYKEQLKKSFGKSKEYDHPSYLLRVYLAGSVFVSLMDSFGFGNKKKEMIHYIVLTDKLYLKEEYDGEIIRYDYKPIFDGSIVKHMNIVIDYCNNTLNKKTEQFSRIKYHGEFKIDFKLK